MPSKKYTKKTRGIPPMPPSIRTASRRRAAPQRLVGELDQIAQGQIFVF